MKNLSIILLIFTFLAFLLYQNQKSTEFEVLEIKSPTEIVIDLNKNSIEDDGELITLTNIKSFKVKPSTFQTQLAKSLKISEEDAIGMGFLAENFVKETLADKKVRLKKTKKHVIPKHPSTAKSLIAYIRDLNFMRCRIKDNSGLTQKPMFRQDVNNENTQIWVDNKNYETALLNSGLAIKDEKLTPQFLKNVEKVRKLNLRIFNNKSHKYHKLTCKYGLIAHNSQILPLNQLPKDAKPCKFCHLHKEKVKSKNAKAGYCFNDEIPNIKSPATFLQVGDLKIFLTDFTRTLKPSNSCATSVCKALVDEINSSQNSIDFAIYGYTKVPAIQKALENAQKRGVKVRFVYDLNKNGENIYPDTQYLSNILPNNNHDSENSIMHDKFFIFDGRKVLTGSANISNTDMSGYNSNAIILINSAEIANLYSQEFEQMYAGKFHKKKMPLTSLRDVENIRVYFSPKDRAITNQVVPLIDNSKKYIYIPAFLITHKELAQSLVNASNRGVAVKIILDATNTHDGSHSKIKFLRANGIKIKTEIFAGKLHSKSIIIDDMYTVIGSMNFSKGGENINDENLVIIKDEQVAHFYKNFFLYSWQRIPDKWLYKNARAEAPESIGSCSDGIDNDFDGKTDKADDSCRVNKIDKGYKKR